MPQTKVFSDLHNTVFDIIDAADERGYSRFITPKQYLRGRSLRTVMNDTLSEHAILTSNAKTWLKKIEATHTVLDNGDWLVTFNAARLFGLPGDAPSEELSQLRALFEIMKSHFIANAQAKRPGIVRLMNEHDSNGRVYGSLCCLSSASSDNGVDIGKQLQSVINASPVLLHFQRSYALKLSRIGRYSWSDMREENFFAPREQPWKAEFARKWHVNHNEASAA